jgi:hypothetical protein
MNGAEIEKDLSTLNRISRIYKLESAFETINVTEKSYLKTS